MIFTSYTWILFSNEFGYWIILSIFFSFLITLPFTFILIFLSKKLKDIYFSIWTFAIYILIYQLARNLEITGWTMWISIESQKLFFNIELLWIIDFLIFSLIITFLVIMLLLYIEKTYFFKILKWWWENEDSIKILWIKSSQYKASLIILTTFLASIWANMNSFYIWYIESNSFWITFLVPILLISIISYKYSSIYVFLTSIFVIWIYELLRLLPFWDYSQIWYFRELFFTFLIMIIAYIVFRNSKDFRDI